MLTREIISKALIGVVEGFDSEGSQIWEAQGLDAILELLANLRTVTFPCAILEGRSSGSIQLVEGPVDFFTQSVWIMGQFARDESESELYDATFAMGKLFLSKLRDMAVEGEAALAEWDWSRIQYMKRYGGQNARGWEFVLTFTENISLLLPEPTKEPEDIDV